jgi:hypothetical protein
MRTDDLSDQAKLLAEAIADRAVETLRGALQAQTPEEQANLAALEKRITRARRAVEKAISLLDER